MPEYLGDRATVLPSNTQAIMHWSNVFEQRRREKERQRRADELAEQQRRASIAKYFGDKLGKIDLSKTFDYRAIIEDGIGDTWNYLEKAYRDKIPTEQILMEGSKMAAQWKGAADRASLLTDNVTKGVAEIMKKDPYVDGETLTNAALHDAAYGDGDKIRSISEIDPVSPYAQQAYNKYADILYDPKDAGKANDEFWARQGKQLRDENATQILDDKTKDLVRQGYTGKLPPQARVLLDESGEPVLQKNGKPVVELTATENYRLPGSGEDLKDDEGNTVKVMGREQFEQYYTGPMRALIDRRANPIISAKGQSKDSDYGDMVRRQVARELMLRDVGSRFGFTLLEDKSAAAKSRLLRDKIAQASLALRRQANARAAAKAKKEDVTDLPIPLMYKYAEDVATPVQPSLLPDGLTKKVPGAKNMMRIYTRDIDKGDLATILGGTAGGQEKGSRNVKDEQTGKYKDVPNEKSPHVEPYSSTDGDYYIIDVDTGNWYGKDHQVISIESAYDRQLKGVNSIKKSSTEVKKRGGVRGILDNLRSTIKGAKRGAVNDL